MALNIALVLSGDASAEASMHKVTAVLTGTDKAQQSLRQSIVAGTAANDNATKQTKLAAHEMTNLTYQMNDMAMMLMSGQSPYMVMLQQGAQVSQIMGPRGLGQIIPAVGAALVGLINPTTLLLAGMTAVGYGAKYVFDQMQGGALGRATAQVFGLARKTR